jgi:hypothetical protein
MRDRLQIILVAHRGCRHRGIAADLAVRSTPAPSRRNRSEKAALDAWAVLALADMTSDPPPAPARPMFLGQIGAAASPAVDGLVAALAAAGRLRRYERRQPRPSEGSIPTPTGSLPRWPVH